MRCSKLALFLCYAPPHELKFVGASLLIQALAGKVVDMSMAENKNLIAADKFGRWSLVVGIGYLFYAGRQIHLVCLPRIGYAVAVLDGVGISIAVRGPDDTFADLHSVLIG